MKDLVEFFEQRNLHDVAQGLKKDLKQNTKNSQQNVLGMVRKAVVQSDRRNQITSEGTNERNRNRNGGGS